MSNIIIYYILEYDLLITNPPYSGDHKLKLLDFLKTSRKPFLLLLPVYTATKSYWREFTTLQGAWSPQVIYLLPGSKYAYDHPEGTGHDDSPFYSAWFIGGMGDKQQYAYCCLEL